MKPRAVMHCIIGDILGAMPAMQHIAAFENAQMVVMVHVEKIRITRSSESVLF